MHELGVSHVHGACAQKLQMLGVAYGWCVVREDVPLLVLLLSDRFSCFFSSLISLLVGFDVEVMVGVAC